MAAMPEGPVRAVVLDIEGTTTPISFVHTVLFPYAAAHAEAFLREHADAPDVRAAVAALHAQVRTAVPLQGCVCARLIVPVWRCPAVPWSACLCVCVSLSLCVCLCVPVLTCALAGTDAVCGGQAVADVAAGVAGAVPIASVEDRGAVLASVRWQMQQDRKSTALKALQGLIWHTAYASGAVRGAVYDDVPPALRRWQAAHTPVYIYSSGSIGAAHLSAPHGVRTDD
jgi:methionine salvage enolase-phosphatase E1